MKQMARGKVAVTQDELLELFNLPEDTVITSVEFSMDESMMVFNIRTEDPVEKLTVEYNPEMGNQNVRRVRVPLKTDKTKEKS